MKRLGWNYILANGVGNGTGWNPGDDKEGMGGNDRNEVSRMKWIRCKTEGDAY